MGWFSNNKKLCPICGNPTPRLLPTKVEGAPICKECSGKVDLPEDALEGMTLEQFRQYIAFYEANQALRGTFEESYRFSFGFLSGCLVLDMPHRLFRLNGLDSSLVFEAAHLASFRILEDGAPLFEGGRQALRHCPSGIPARVKAMGPQLAQFQMQMRQYEQMERMMNQRSGEKGSTHLSCQRPDIDLLKPFRQFQVELTLEHPYWGSYAGSLEAPGFSEFSPSIDGYLRDYQEKVEELLELARQLMQIFAPDAPELPVGAEAGAAPQPAAPAASAVEEIRQYKALLDADAITEEEFTAKKRQLMGI